jgi:dihydroorotase
MDTLYTFAKVFENGRWRGGGIAVRDGFVISAEDGCDGGEAVATEDLVAVPAFADIHVHLREPGFAAKETIATGTAAAAAGGYADVCAMPNLVPVPDSPETLRPQLEAIAQGARVRVHPFGAITVGERGESLADLEGLAPFVCGFSDDGHGVQDAGLLREAMQRARALGRPIVAHCEVNALLMPGGCVHAGRWASAHGFPGISSESEWRMVERDLALVRETRCPYHVCHVSTRESIALIRAAKAEGLPVTCETAPHYLVLCEDDLRDEGRFKMNPPLRAAADRDALVGALLDGTVDCIATDHAPHTAAEKARGLRGSPFGVVGLECAFAVLYTKLVATGIAPLELLLDRLSTRPRRIVGLPEVTLAPGTPADFALLDLHADETVHPARFRSMGHATPFEGMRIAAAVRGLVLGGHRIA